MTRESRETHTAEPWFVADWKNDFGAELFVIEARKPEKVLPKQSSIWPDGIQCIQIADCEGGDGNRIANARRICAAVNAAAGIPLEALEAGVIGQMKAALEEAEEYFDQRADAEYFTDSPQLVPNEEMRLLAIVRAALASLQTDTEKD